MFLVPPGQNATRPTEYEAGRVSVTYRDVCSFYSPLITYTYNNANLGCVNLASGSQVIPGGNNSDGGSIERTISGLYAPDVPPGTQVCHALTIFPASSWGRSSDNQSTEQRNDEATNTSPANPYRWWSEPQCYTVGKQPMVQVLGAGLNVPGNVSTSQTIKSFGPIGGTSDPLAVLTDNHRRVYGAWSQFEIVAGGDIRTSANGLTGMASGSAFGSYGLCTTMTSSCAPGSGGRPDEQDWSRQTITNYGVDALGGYVRTLLPTIETRIAAECTPGNTGLINGCEFRGGASGEWIVGTGIGGVNLGRGQVRVWHVSGNATITGNITYSEGPFNGPGELPQAIIVVTGDLFIMPNVTRIDAWIIVNGTIDTCFGWRIGMGINACNNKLVFNGPVSAGRISLNRTGGAGVNNSLRTFGCGEGINSCHGTGPTVYGIVPGRDNSGDPAEVFNLRGDTFLWAYYQSLRGGQARTTYVREVAPRF